MVAMCLFTNAAISIAFQAETRTSRSRVRTLMPQPDEISFVRCPSHMPVMTQK